MVLGYAWLIVISAVAGLLLQSRMVRVCGGLELEDDGVYGSCGSVGWGGGATSDELALAVLHNTTHLLPHFRGQLVLSLPYTLGPIAWSQHLIEQRMLLRAVSLSFWFYFATSAVATVVLAWGVNPEGRSMVWKQLQSKHRKARKRDKGRVGGKAWSAIGPEANPVAAGNAVAAVSSPSQTESVLRVSPNPPSVSSSWSSEPSASNLNEFDRWLWGLACQHQLHGLRFLLLIDSDRLEGLRQLRTDESLRADVWDEDTFLNQYLILLEVVGQMVLASKMWGVRTLDGWLLTNKQKDAAQAIQLYQRRDTEDQPTNTQDKAKQAPKGGAAVAVHPGGDDKAQALRAVSVVSSVSLHPVVRLSASHWKLCSLIVSFGLATWMPLLAAVNYRSYVLAVDALVFAGLFCFMFALTYLVGRVLQYPYLCYSEAWISVLTLYHTKLRLTQRNQLKVWRDLRHYLVLYRLPLLFGLAQWSLMALTLTAVIGLLLCIVRVWLDGFTNFIVWYSGQCMVLMTAVSLVFSFGMLASAVSVWEQQQAHIRLLQDTKFAILLKQRKINAKHEDEQERKEAENDHKPTRSSKASTAAGHKSAKQPSSAAAIASAPAASVSDSLVLRSVEELMSYISDHDQAPTAFGFDIKPTLFRILQGYIVTAIASLLVKYGTKGTE